MTVEDVARELYGLAPEEFTSARNARAKEARAAGDPELAAEVQALRKPTAGAWLLNQLVRRHPEEVAQVLDLGGRLRAAQGSLGAPELRALDAQRRQLTRAVAEEAATIGRDAGRRVSAQVTGDVEESLRSAMVDSAAGAALASGLLTDTFSSTGLEPVDLSRVTALAGTASPTPSSPELDAGASRPSDPAGTGPGADRSAAKGRGGAGRGKAATEERQRAAEEEKRAAEHARRLADATRTAAEAQRAAQAARAAADRAGEEVLRARRRRKRVESERDTARRLLDDLEDQLVEASDAEGAAARAHEVAQRRSAAAAEELERLLAAVEDLSE